MAKYTQEDVNKTKIVRVYKDMNKDTFVRYRMVVQTPDSKQYVVQYFAEATDQELLRQIQLWVLNTEKPVPVDNKTKTEPVIAAETLLKGTISDLNKDK